MPVWPYTGMTDGGLRSPLHRRKEGESEIADVISVILEAGRVPPPPGQVSSSTDKLRSFIGKTARAVRAAAKQLPEGDARRCVVAKAVDEALYLAEHGDPGSGLLSAFAYCRSLAQAAQQLRGLEEQLILLAQDSSTRGRAR
ncbi:DUF6415 family natural product biosynthesis protein [Streptoverticillium reticulum]|uniref:DUF6415 family natural product biosynthesis protein n=1 Tax=Streptoverticillium reticulum TaxID=1433415 RepID=UPI0039BF9EA4